MPQRHLEPGLRLPALVPSVAGTIALGSLGILTWIQVGTFRADFGLAMDRLSGLYVLFVTFPRVPQGDSARIDEPNPGTCPGV